MGLQLEKAGYRATSLQGNLSQNQRQAALDGFRDGSHQILVATDIAARGIDVSRISHVINYDMPDTIDAYTHRIGRTGRAEKTGDAFTFMTREDEAMVRSIERILGEEVERRTLKSFDYKKPAPARDVEFARSLHEPRRRLESGKPKTSRARTSAAAPQKKHQVEPTRETGNRGFAPQRPSGSTTHKYRANKSGPRR